MKIFPIPALKDNYIWAIVHHQQAIIIDPGESTPVINFLNQHDLSLSAIFITHHHWDHTNGIASLINHVDIPVWGPRKEKEKVKYVTHPVAEKDIIFLDQFPYPFQIVDIPGHTLGHIAYYTPDILFCGDTLFSAGCGRLFEGTPQQLYTSLLKLASLPDETIIYCAHEYTLQNLRFAKAVEPDNVDIINIIKEVEKMREKNLPSLPSTLRLEKKVNPFLRCHSSTLITQVEKYARTSLQDPLEVFTWLRKWKDVYT